MNEIPGGDVAALPIRMLARLPAPWAIKLRIGSPRAPGGEVEIVARSAMAPGCWGPAELTYLLAAVVLGRVTREQVIKAARSRGRIGEAARYTWDQVSAGLAGVDPGSVDGTVGDALERIGGVVIGAWSGADAGVSEASHGRERRAWEQGEDDLRGLQPKKGGARRRTVPPVSGRSKRAGEDAPAHPPGVDPLDRPRST